MYNYKQSRLGKGAAKTDNYALFLGLPKHTCTNII